MIVQPALPVRAAGTTLRLASTAETTAIVDGTRITMIAPVFRTLPRSALVRVTVRVTNVTRVPLQVPRRCELSNPRVVVANGHGQVVYTTLHPGSAPRHCRPGSVDTLRPGRSEQRSVYVVMRGPVLVPVVQVVRNGQVVRLAGMRYRYAMSRRYNPPVSAAEITVGGREEIARNRTAFPLYSHRRILALLVTPPSPPYGPLVGIASIQCPHHFALVYHWTVISRVRGQVRIAAPCPRPGAWNLMLGWVGESIAYIQIGRGSLIPTGG